MASETNNETTIETAVKTSAPAPVKTAPAPAPAPTNFIELSIIKGASVEFTNTSSGKKGVLSIVENSLLLQKSHIYKVQLANKQQDIDNFNVVKLTKEVAKKINVLTIDTGYVYLIPIVHGVTITNKDILGILI